MKIASSPKGASDAAEDESILEAEHPTPTESVAYGPNTAHIADIFRPTGSPFTSRVVMFIHGGYWRPAVDRQHARSLARALADEGYVVCSIEYRRVPGEPDLMIADIDRALETLPALVGLGDAPVILAGHSAGGHLALIAATRHPLLVAGVVALAPITDLQAAESLHLGAGAVEAFLGTPASERPDLDPVRCPAPGMRVTVIHGARDTIVPVAQAHSLAEAWPGTCRVMVVDGSAHFELIDPSSAAWAVVRGELDDQCRSVH